MLLKIVVKIIIRIAVAKETTNEMSLTVGALLLFLDTYFLLET
jgi:uncharacterized membrane protein